MQEFERRGTGAARQLILHAYLEQVVGEERCARCNHLLKDAYLVSVSGERGTHQLCPGCHSWAKAAYGERYESRIEIGGA